MIIDCNAWTLPQEALQRTVGPCEQEVGIVVRSHRHVADALAQMLKAGALEQFRARAAAMDNRAILEIPAIFEKILGESSENVVAESESKI